MANGLREVVKDPLALNADSGKMPDRSQGLGSVRGPSSDYKMGSDPLHQIVAQLGEVQNVLATEVAFKRDEAVAQGKMLYMAGATEQELAAKGDMFTSAGYNVLKARDSSNIWYQNQLQSIEQSDRMLSPEAYQEELSKRRAQYLEGITDPTGRRIATAALEDFSPRLVGEQMKMNSGYERGRTRTAYGQALESTAGSSGSSTRVVPGGLLAVSPSVVSTPIASADNDRDIGIRTMLGEASGEGSVGLAAVAHVLKNRALDGGYGGSTIAKVALSPQQFSAWNSGAGGNNPGRYSADSATYKRAGEIYDAVMAGRVPDMTNGATHYYSPAGMHKLVAEGSQTNSIPRWLAAEQKKSGGQIRIGGHIFVGRARNVQSQAQLQPGPQGAADEAGGATQGYVIGGSQPEAAAVASASPVGTGTGAPEDGTQGPPMGTSARQLAASFPGLSPEDRADVIADTAVRTLSQGNPTLFNDLGGLGGLSGLGLNSDQLNRVNTAKERYDKEKENEFSVEKEKWRSDVITRAANGEDPDKLLEEIDQRRAQDGMSDAHATSLAREVITKSASADARAAKEAKATPKPSGALDNPEVQRAAVTAVRRIQASMSDPDPKNWISAEQATNEVLDVANKYGANKTDVEDLVKRMLATEQSEYERQVAAVKAANEKYKNEQGIKDQVDVTLSRGIGLADVKGNLTATNSTGHQVQVSAQEYGVQKLKEKAVAEYKQHVAEFQQTQGARGMPEDQASAEVFSVVYTALAKQGVVDTEAQREWQGALRGNIMDPTTKLPSTAAKKAFDAYLQLKSNPNIPQSYLDKIFDDPNVAGLLATADYMRGDTLDLETALVNADARLSNREVDPTRKLQRDVVFNATVQQKTDEFLNERWGSATWGATLFGKEAQGEDEKFILANSEAARRYVSDMADAAYMTNPNIPPEVAVQMGIDKLKGNVDQAGGNLFVTRGGALGPQLGLREPGALDVAVEEYLLQIGPGVPGWRTDFGTLTAQERGVLSWLDAGAAVSDATGVNVAGKRTPAYSAIYNPRSKSMIIDLYLDKERTKLMGKPIVIPMDEVVQRYQDKRRDPGTWESLVNGAMRRTKDLPKVIEFYDSP